MYPAACRQGMGVTGGEPLGFDVGAQGAGGTLKGLDLVRTPLQFTESLQTLHNCN